MKSIQILWRVFLMAWGKEYDLKFCIYPESNGNRNVNARTKGLDKEEEEKYEWDSYVFMCPLMSAELVISCCKLLCLQLLLSFSFFGVYLFIVSFWSLAKELHVKSLSFLHACQGSPSPDFFPAVTQRGFNPLVVLLSSCDDSCSFQVILLYP